MTAQTCLIRVEAALMLGISLATRDQLIKAGHLPVIQGRRILMRSTTPNPWLERDEARRGQAVAPGPQIACLA